MNLSIKKKIRRVPKVSSLRMILFAPVQTTPKSKKNWCKQDGDIQRQIIWNHTKRTIISKKYKAFSTETKLWKLVSERKSGSRKKEVESLIKVLFDS